MSYATNNAAIAHSFPAYDVVIGNPLPAYRGGVVEIKAGDTLAMGYASTRHGQLFRTYTAGSVISYALHNGECPVAAHARCIANGHAAYWLNENAVCISNRQQARKVHILIEAGQIVRFEGRFFRIELVRPGGEHLKMTQVDAPEGTRN